MSREPDDAHVVGEILAAELCPHADPLGDFEDLLLHVEIPKRAPVLITPRGKAIQILGARQLDRL